ncbi:MAG TPA: transcription elongation factor GreB, partial [Methylomirabilota bacterium]|nr:transcription elongation factor GreB [Methylomirabilota bacterium]
MSKAFTRESDEAPNSDPGVRPAPVLPAGAPNYLTPTGAARLREELARLAETERPRLATSAGDDAPALRARDQRIAHLRRSLATAVVVPPPPTGEDRVRFGATVRVRDQAGHETAY